MVAWWVHSVAKFELVATYGTTEEASHERRAIQVVLEKVPLSYNCSHFSVEREYMLRSLYGELNNN